MFCKFCGRKDGDCPCGIWRGPQIKGSEGICIYCARAALRALGGMEEAPVVPIRGSYRFPGYPPFGDGPEAA
jgi:hypothetical protein